MKGFGLALLLVSGLSASLGMASRPVLEADASKDSSSYSIKENETSLASDDLSALVDSSTKTDTMESLHFLLASQVTTYQNDYDFQNVFVTVSDPSFDPDTLPELSADAPLSDYPHFEATVYKIRGKRKVKDILIPSTLKYTTQAVLDIVSIGSDAVDGGYSNIASVTIPNTVTSISDGAFVDVPDSVAFHVEGSEEDYGEAWHQGGQVTYSYSLSEDEKSYLDQTSYGPVNFGKGNSYLCGYAGEGDYDLPLLLSYDVLDLEGNKKKSNELAVLPLQSKNVNYDTVGDRNSLDFYADIPMGKEERIDMSSLVLHNIFPRTRDENNAVVPDLSSPYSSQVVSTAPYLVNLSDLIVYEAARSSSFSGYTEVDVKVKKIGNVYAKFMPSAYEKYLKRIQSGDVRVRYLFSGLGLSHYEVSSSAGEKTLSIGSPFDYAQIQGEEMTMGFLLKDSDISSPFHPSDLKKFSLTGFTLRLDLFSDDDGAIMKNTIFAPRFGEMVLYEKESMPSPSYSNLSLSSVLTILIYAIVYFACATLYYFYGKKKYRNDEFRRIVPKRYWAKATKNFFQSALIVMAVFFIVARAGIMNNAVVTYNPLDVYVIIFGVAAIIAIGFYIRDIVVQSKDRKARKQAEKLHLDPLKSEDGTH